MSDEERALVLLPPGAPLWFPDPLRAGADGELAFGADLSVPRLLLAYRTGIFPWFTDEYPIVWWSPDPRARIEPERLHVSARLARRLRSGVFRFTWDRAFERVMRACGERREGTWIVPRMLRAYAELHRAGHAHSVEVWCGDDLVGGIYGVHVGGVFAGESMFHRVTDASKAALVVAVRSLFRRGIVLFDAQMPNPHILRMGATVVSRAEHVAAIRRAAELHVDLAGLELTWEA